MLARFRPSGLLWLLLPIGLLNVVGCHEGPLWRAGKYTPWAREQWEAEEQIADTLFSRKREMTEMTTAAVGGPLDQQQRVAEQLAEVAQRDPVMLLRLHAVVQLGRLNCPQSMKSLKLASHDHHSDIRLAAIRAWQGMPSDQAIPHLQEILGSDTDIDVRLAATRALANFSGQQAIQAVSLALNDPDPALQLRATESLQQITGESFGPDVRAWQQFVGNFQVADLGPHGATDSGELK